MWCPGLITCKHGFDTVNERRITERRIIERWITERRIIERRITEHRIIEHWKLPNVKSANLELSNAELLNIKTGTDYVHVHVRVTVCVCLYVNITPKQNKFIISLPLSVTYTAHLVSKIYQNFHFINYACAYFCPFFGCKDTVRRTKPKLSLEVTVENNFSMIWPWGMIPRWKKQESRILRRCLFFLIKTML